MSPVKITAHLRERYVERNDKKFKHLSDCKDSNCKRCVDLVYDIREILRSNGRAINEELAKLIDSSKEDRSYFNDSMFMDRYYNKYGYDHRFQFLVNGDLVFVCVEKDGVRTAVTLLNSRSQSTMVLKHQKFKKKCG